MRQVVQNLKGEVRLLELPIPAIREGGVLVRTVHSLVSAGTERMNVERSRRSLLARARERPDLVRQVIARMKRDGITAALRGVQDKLESWIPMGYSSAGIVEALGRGVTGLQVGDAVACAGAGYASHAEVTWVPRNLCARIPTGPDGATLVPLEDAAWSTLGAIALQGVRQLEPRLGECVAVIGLGLLGLLSVQLLRANGCEVLAADPDPDRCRLAEQFGAREATAPGAAFAAAVERRTGGRGADGVLITAATESRDPIVHAGRWLASAPG
ncbi:MAG: zinc-binding dehydrogenase [Gemmatimonadetes bacterium]|nr:zinc-binding dehydrogenase [Gemmatimonadota bacterium]